MRILHLSTYDAEGGAAIAANLLHRTLNSRPEINSKMLVSYKSSNDPTIIQAYSSLIERKIRNYRYRSEIKLCRRATQKYGETFSTGLIPFSLLPSKIKKIQPDILHIHWAQYGFLNLNDLNKIKIPIVWTLHDLWPISDGKHYFDENKIEQQKNNFIFRRKRKVYNKTNIEFIAVSNWVMSLLEKSELAKIANCHLISNGIDCMAFSPVEKSVAKKCIKLDPSKKTILFGAVSPFSTARKGFHFLEETLQLIKPDEIQLIIFGADEQEIQIGNHTGICLGKIKNRRILSLIYSAADVMLVPSVYETFGLTAAESLACGTPVVAFNTSGIRDIVDHKENGYLAEAYKTEDLAKGIEWILSHSDNKHIEIAARNKIVHNFEIESITTKHIDFYQSVINAR